MNDQVKPKPNAWFRKAGPGMLVAAAFIGPGTVTVASRAGAEFGTGLAWVVLFAVFAAIVFQEMAARLGIATGKDLAQTLRGNGRPQWYRWPAVALALAAVLVGNIAYQGGNLAGAAIGLEGLTGMAPALLGSFIAVVAATLLWFGRLKLIQRVMMALVAIMSAVFCLAVAFAQPDWGGLFSGVFRPAIPAGGMLSVVGLLGTTVVPYNLFLHSRSAAENWNRQEGNDSSESLQTALTQARWDTGLSIGLGGLITLAVLLTASTAFFANEITIQKLQDVAIQLEPVLGKASQFAFCAGLFAAGLTSAITAPLAAGIVAAGCFGWPSNLRDWRTRTVMMLVIGVGLIVVVFLGAKSPSELILVAQAANGLILPVIALFLVLVMNSRRLQAEARNGWWGNFAAIFLLVVVSFIAWKSTTDFFTQLNNL